MREGGHEGGREVTREGGHEGGHEVMRSRGRKGARSLLTPARAVGPHLDVREPQQA